MNDKKRTLSIVGRGLTNFESIMWIFTRLSALGMYGFMLVALIGALIMGARYQMNLADVMRWAFIPNGAHVQSTNIPDLAPWATIFWMLVASGMLLLATAHGVHGLVVIVDDYIVTVRGRNIVRVLSIIFMTAMSFIGLYLIWTA